MVKVSTDYIAVGGNRHPAAADWDAVTGVLAFGAVNNVALWDPLVLPLILLFKCLRKADRVDSKINKEASRLYCAATPTKSTLLNSSLKPQERRLLYSVDLWTGL